MAFSADLDQVRFPVLLASGEQLSFPLTFHGRGGYDDFPSLLGLVIASGAREGGGGMYFGGFEPCTPTCAGDCDGSGTVTVDELIRGVHIALGGDDLDACALLDTDADAVVSVAELVAAVERALAGCES